ncbi:OB-fold protein, partial [Cognatilysobacter lacus]
DIAFRTTVTAVELSSAYDAGAAAADKQFKGQRLLVAGMVESLEPDAPGGPLVSLAAGEFAPVQARGLERDAAAALKVGQQIILACNGAGATGGKATVNGCKVTTQ